MRRKRRQQRAGYGESKSCLIHLSSWPCRRPSKLWKLWMPAKLWYTKKQLYLPQLACCNNGDVCCSHWHKLMKGDPHLLMITLPSRWFTGFCKPLCIFRVCIHVCCGQTQHLILLFKIWWFSMIHFFCQLPDRRNKQFWCSNKSTSNYPISNL